MQLWIRLWRSFFSVVGKVLAIGLWSGVLTGLVMLVVGLVVPHPGTVALPAVSILALAVVGAWFAPLLGPHLTGLSAGLLVTLGGWYVCLWHYIWWYQGDWPLNMLSVVACPLVGLVLYRGYVWAAASPIYRIRPTFEQQS